jgi:hypothetical protein
MSFLSFYFKLLLKHNYFELSSEKSQLDELIKQLTLKIEQLDKELNESLIYITSLQTEREKITVFFQNKL